MRALYLEQAPRVVEDQVTYPLTTSLLSVPGATTVRGYSFYGDSFVNVLFADGTDPYWARSRVLEYLNQATARLPEGVRVLVAPLAGVSVLCGFVGSSVVGMSLPFVGTYRTPILAGIGVAVIRR